MVSVPLTGPEEAGRAAEAGGSRKSSVPDHGLPREGPLRWTLVQAALSHPERVCQGRASGSLVSIQPRSWHLVGWCAGQDLLRRAYWKPQSSSGSCRARPSGRALCPAVSGS